MNLIITGLKMGRVTKQHWLIGFLAVFFTLAIMGLMNDQDAKLLAKKHVKLTVYASAEVK